MVRDLFEQHHQMFHPPSQVRQQLLILLSSQYLLKELEMFQNKSVELDYQMDWLVKTAKLDFLTLIMTREID